MSIIKNTAQNEANAAKAAKQDELDRKVAMDGLAKLAADKAAADERAKMAIEMYKYGGMNPNVVSPFAVPSRGVDAAGYMNGGSAAGPNTYPVDTRGAEQLMELDRLNKLYGGNIAGGFR